MYSPLRIQVFIFYAAIKQVLLIAKSYCQQQGQYEFVVVKSFENHGVGAVRI